MICFPNTAEIHVRLPKDRPVVSSVNWTSAVIKWKKIPNVPDGLSDHYQYAIEYKEWSDEWTEWPTLYNHDPSINRYQEATMTGLTRQTYYVARVKSYRILGEDRAETSFTPFAVFITCPGKSIVRVDIVL